MTSEQQKPTSEQQKPAAPTSNPAPSSTPSLAPEQNPGDNRPSNDNPGQQRQK